MKVKNILVLTYWSYDSALIQTYTLPYIDIIKNNISSTNKIYLLTLTAKKNTSAQNYAETKLAFLNKGIHLINFNYSPFGIFMLFKLLYIFCVLFYVIVRNNISHIHAWCTPAGALGYILSKLTGKPLILDSFEPHAESMIETGTWRKNGFNYKVLFKLEKLQLKRAAHVICAAKGMVAYSQQTYGVIKTNYFIKPAGVDSNLFKPLKKEYHLLEGITSENIVCVYAGKFGGIYLEKEVFDFFHVAESYFGEKFKVVLLTNESDETITAYCSQSNVNKDTVIKKFVPHADVPKYMALGNFGICPVKPVPTKEFCTPIKNGEYWAMGLPVVITKNISVDSDIIQSQNIGYVLKELNSNEYLKALKHIEDLLRNKENLKNKIVAIAKKERSFSIADSIYKAIYS